MRNRASLFRAKAASNQFLKGFAVSLADATLSEMAGCAGYDFVFIDAEHSPLGRQDIYRHIAAAQGAGSAAFVRVRGVEPNLLKSILDMGPDGIIFPFVHDGETARRAVAACAYPDVLPSGVRGEGPIRATRYGFGKAEAYLADPGDWCLTFMQIESYEGYQNLDDILRTEGVDGVYIGPADLTRSMKANQAPETVSQVCADVFARVRAAGKLMGTPLSADRQGVETAIAQGAQWGVCGMDIPMVAQGMRQALSCFPPLSDCKQKEADV